MSFRTEVVVERECVWSAKRLVSRDMTPDTSHTLLCSMLLFLAACSISSDT